MNIRVEQIASPVPTKPYGFCGHKAPWKKKNCMQWKRKSAEAVLQSKTKKCTDTTTVTGMQHVIVLLL